MNIKVFENKIEINGKTYFKNHFKSISIEKRYKYKLETFIYLFIAITFIYMCFNFNLFGISLFIVSLIFPYIMRYSIYYVIVNNGFIPIYETRDKKEAIELKKHIENFIAGN